KKPFLYAVIIILALFNIGLALLVRGVAQAMSEPVTGSQVFSAEPGPDVPTLQYLAANAASDEEILQIVTDYYEANKALLSVLWREENETRLAALFSMYIVPISTIYRETTYPASLPEYLTQERAHCGTYTYMQIHIGDALGLNYRTVE